MPRRESSGQPADPTTNFAAHLRTRRQVLRMSQADLAERAGECGFPTQQQTIAKIESGVRPIRLDEAVALARAVGVSITSMLGPGVMLSAEELEDALRESNEAIATLEQERDEAEAEREAAKVALQKATERYGTAMIELVNRISERNSLVQRKADEKRAKGTRGGQRKAKT